MKRFLYLAAMLAIGSAIYEAAQWFRPTDFVVAFERWYWGTGGILLALIMGRTEA